MSYAKIFHDDTTDYEQILSAVKEHFDEEKHMGDENWYDDFLHEEIDAYVVKYDYDAEKVVIKYDVFKAISLYEDQYGEDYYIEKNEKNYKNYLKLYYAIIDVEFIDKYSEELEDMANEDKYMKKRIEDQFKMIEELKKENEELKKKVAELTPAPTPRKLEDPINEIKEVKKEPKKMYKCPCGAELNDKARWRVIKHEETGAHKKWVEANKK
tara:strand:- start:307 stop:942 length:636 start_codon:yes stop_codon:yes gene_type:complete